MRLVRILTLRVCFLMIRRTPRSTRTDTPVPSTTPLRSARAREEVRAIRGELLEQSRPARSLDEVKAEVQVLQQLVAQISAKPAEPESGAPRPPQPARQIDPHELAEIDVRALVRDAIRHDRTDRVLPPIARQSGNASGRERVCTNR